MDFGAIIGVVLGMVLVYSLLSIIVTQVNALLTIILKTRASHLRDGIASLIPDQDMQAQVLRHPLLNVVTDVKQTGLDRLWSALSGRQAYGGNNPIIQLVVSISNVVNRVFRRNVAPLPMQAQNAQLAPGTLTEPALSGVTWIDTDLFSTAVIDTLLTNAKSRFHNSLTVRVSEALEKVLEKKAAEAKKQITTATQEINAAISQPQAPGAVSAQAALTTSQITETEIQIFREKLNAYKIGSITLEQLEDFAICFSDPHVANEMKSAIDRFQNQRDEFEVDVRERNLEEVLQGVSQVSDPATKKTLETLLASAEKLDDAQTRLGKWFDARMGQTKESFERHIKLYTLIIGFVITAILNVDSIQLANSLYTSPVVRDSVSQVASAFVAQQATSGTAQTATTGSENIEIVAGQAASALNQVANLNLPIGWEYKDVQCNSIVGQQPPVVIVTTPTAAVTPTPTEPATATPIPPEATGDVLQFQASDAAQETFVPFAEPIQDFSDPSLGIDPAFATATPEVVPPAEANTVTDGSNAVIELAPCNDRRNLALIVPFSGSFNFGSLFIKVVGLLFTTFAIGQGAPFWFDLLNRIVGRGSGSAGAPITVQSPVTVNLPSQPVTNYSPIPPSDPNASGGQPPQAHG
ncbi:MAG: hypothetical protein SF162_15780 [bacterium]|nr:hypothetical protein [bacterium]